MGNVRIIYLMILFALSSCGGGTDCGGTVALLGSITAPTCNGNKSGGDAVQTATGYFKDNSTEGITVVSGSTTSITGADGSFIYEVGKPITFSVGKIVLGSIDFGKSIVTPMDLVAEGTISSNNVTNIVRFLMMLDEDGDPGNGIKFSQAAKVIVNDAAQIDFSIDSGAFASNLDSLASRVKSADGGTHNIATAAAAESHLSNTVRCTWSGAFKGAYSGISTSRRYTDTGVGYFIIDAKTGIGRGAAVGTATDSQINASANYSTLVIGTESMALNNQAAIVIGTAGAGVTFEGRLNTPDIINGTWTSTANPLDTKNGTFSVSRVGGLSSAKYRFTGFSSDNMIITIDVTGSAANVISGNLVNPATGGVEAISGTLSGAALAAQSASGVAITATMNLLDGTVSNGLKGAATFNATGCTLI